MDPLDYSENSRRQTRQRLFLSIASEVAKEALNFFASAIYKLLCGWVSFFLILLVQIIPFWFVIYFYTIVWPNLTNEVHWAILAIPVLIVTYISRSLFTVALDILHSFAQQRWGRAYSRRIPRWMVSKRILRTTKDLKSSFSGLVSFYQGIIWLPQKVRRWRESGTQSQETVCPVCQNLERRGSYSGEIVMNLSDLWETAESCVICGTFLAALCRHYPPKDTLKEFHFQWKHYHPGSQIVLTWNKNNKSLYVELPNIISVWPRISFYCLGKGPGLPFISSPRAAVDDTQSEATMHRVLSWIVTCTTEHEHCTKNQPKPLPDRVLDLGDSPDSLIRLIETGNKLGYYICLSYRWGRAENFKTLEANKAVHMSGVPVAALPKTIHDAIIVCQRLGIRYFWVDALCIVQDSDEDRERQIPKMASIYENAFFTVAATKANGHDEGLHPDGKVREVILDRIPAEEIGHGLEEDIFVRLEYPDNGGVRHWDIPSPDQQHEEEWPLLTRAWVFQERLLSPRMLHFAKRELVWECRTGVFCDCGREHEEKSADLEFRRLVSTKSIKTSDATPDELRALWYAIVERYSRLMGNLTNESDAFPALAGLATRISGLLEDEYAAGLWRSNMVEGLLWTCKDEKYLKSRARPKEWRAPSWSWASMMDEISYKHSTLKGWEITKLKEVYARVIKIECARPGSERTGPTLPVALTLSGWVSFATVSTSSREKRNWITDEIEQIFSHELIWQHDGHASTLYPDHPEDAIDGETVLCLRLARINNRDWYLALIKDSSAPNTFKRVGLYQGGDVAWRWLSPESWRRRAEQRYHEEKLVLRIV